MNRICTDLKAICASNKILYDADRDGVFTLQLNNEKGLSVMQFYKEDALDIAVLMLEIAGYDADEEWLEDNVPKAEEDEEDEW